MSIADVAARVEQMRTRDAERDTAMINIRMVREGKLEQVAPGLFSDEWPKPVVANFIDVAARDLAEVIAPLPSFNCSAGDRTSDRALKRADRRTRIVNGYVEDSAAEHQMLTGADWWITYGFLPILVEIDFKAKRPRFRFEDPSGVHYDIDRFGRPLRYARIVRKTIDQLAAEWPEYERTIRGPWEFGNGQSQLEVVHYMDHKRSVLYLKDRDNLVLSDVPNPLGRPMFYIAERPGGAGPRGQFDDILWVQLARARFAMYGIEAAHKAVQAPLAVPNDVQEIGFGGDEILRSATPQGIRRVELPIPPGVFQEQQILESESFTGSRFPESRLGGVDASIVTGKGVQALLGGFDTQVKTAQTVMQAAFKYVLSVCLEADEKLWPNLRKKAKGNSNGQVYEIDYTPSTDIDGDYEVDVTYGLMAGLDPNRALIFGLQARGDRLISRDWLRRQMPWSMDVGQEEVRIDMEEMREALKQSVMAYAQAIPVLAQSGQDPSEVLRALSAVIDRRQKGAPLEVAISEAFQPPTPAEGTADAGAPDELGGPAGPSGGGGVDGLQSGGLPIGVARAGQAPGGRPDLQVLLAGLTGSGAPTLGARVERRVPA